MKHDFSISIEVTVIKCECGQEFALFAYCPTEKEDRFWEQVKCDYCPYCGEKLN